MLTRMYEVKGMSCSYCVATVKQRLQAVPGVIGVVVQLDSPQVILSAEAPPEPAVLQEQLGEDYTISLLPVTPAAASSRQEPQSGALRRLGGLFHKKDCCR
ncbi:heavy metal-associated domain-containing protein [Compostibacter hankyongensis]|uniref:HMA domain-containing protein n=1 Tax=Compostibacter hankyongensis TaxID=1007089 RepID=A0ABP8G0I2_9BACT